jgi:hypothetical protein
MRTAVRDLLMAAAALGRHIGQRPLAITKLVELGIEARAIEGLARELAAAAESTWWPD